MNPISALLICLGIFTVGYLYVFIAALRRDAREGQPLTPKPLMQKRPSTTSTGAFGWSPHSRGGTRTHDPGIMSAVL